MNLFILLFSIVMSLLCFWYGFKFVTLYFKVKKWAKTEAYVISKKIELHKKYSTGRSPYAVRVEYSYKYNQKDYSNTTVYLAELMNGQVNHMKSAAEKVIDDIKEKVIVYVNPENPQQSVIFCKGIILYFFIILMGFVSLLIGLSYY